MENDQSGWRAANAARHRNGKRTAFRMALLRITGWKPDDIAEMFGVTRAAVYQQWYRYRSGFY
jgi:hypothetical protein